MCVYVYSVCVCVGMCDGVSVAVCVSVSMCVVFTSIQIVRSYNSTFVQAGKLILSMNKIYEYRHV